VMDCAERIAMAATPTASFLVIVQHDVVEIEHQVVDGGLIHIVQEGKERGDGLPWGVRPSLDSPGITLEKEGLLFPSPRSTRLYE